MGGQSRAFGSLCEAFALISVMSCGGRTQGLTGNTLPDALGGSDAGNGYSIGGSSDDLGSDGGLETASNSDWGNGTVTDSACDWCEAFCDGADQCVAQSAPSRPCTPTDAEGVPAPGFSSGECDKVLGWGWDGTKCIAVIGCSCLGADCGNLLSVQSQCRSAYASCM